MDRDTPQTLSVHGAGTPDAVVATADNGQRIVCEFTRAPCRVQLARRMVAAYNATRHIPVDALEAMPTSCAATRAEIIAQHVLNLPNIWNEGRATEIRSSRNTIAFELQALAKDIADLTAAADKLQARGFFTQTTCADADTNTDMQIFSDALARCKGDAQ